MEDIPAGADLQAVYALCPSGQVPVGGSHRIQDGLVLRFSDFGDLAGGSPACIRASSVSTG